MQKIRINDFTYSIIGKQELEGAAAAFIYYDLNKLDDKWDIKTVSELAKQIFDFCESLGVKAIFIPTLFNLESLDDCKTAIERLSRDLYEISEKQNEFFHKGSEKLIDQ